MLDIVFVLYSILVSVYLKVDVRERVVVGDSVIVIVSRSVRIMLASPSKNFSCASKLSALRSEAIKRMRRARNSIMHQLG